MKTIRTIFASLLLVLLTVPVMAQRVVFPQQEQAGAASVAVAEGADGSTVYTLSNNLFSASFVQVDGHITFGGCDAMNLRAGTELFKLSKTAGSDINASDMTLQRVGTVHLAADSHATRGAERLEGEAIEAVFTQGDLTVTWQAILRDGSHYLRTALDIEAARDTKMYNVVPMLYDVDSGTAGSAPAVSGDTRGSVLICDKIFAGLETPTAFNTSDATNDVAAFDPYTWTVGSFNWTPSELPAGLSKLGYTAGTDIIGKQGYLKLRDAGKQTVTFQYTGGNLRLDMAGVDIVNPATGEVAAADYHHGYTGGNKDRNVYTLDVPAAGIYLVRYFIDLKSDGYQLLTGESKGTITYSGRTKQPTIVYDLPATAQPQVVSINSQLSTLNSQFSTPHRPVTANVISGTTIKESTDEETWLYVINDKRNALSIATTGVGGGLAESAAKSAQEDPAVAWKLVNRGNDTYDIISGLDGSFINPASGSGQATMTTSARQPSAGWSIKPTATNDYYIIVSGKNQINMNNNETTHVYNWGDGANSSDTGCLFTFMATTLPLPPEGDVDDGDTFMESWTGDDSFTPCSSITPRMAELDVTAADVKAISHNIHTLPDQLTLTVTFTFRSGSHRLNTVGVELIDADGNVSAADYHRGFTGESNLDNVYTVTAPTSGKYILRYYVETKTESIASQGIITVNAATEDVIHLPAPDSTPIQGLWSRNTTLKKDNPWHVSAVVGLVAPGQQRRSFLAYSERERAVPWHPCVIYNSWYELNIDRNNGLETENYRGNFTEAQCLDVVQQWKKKLFDPYGVSIDAFVWDDGWDEYGVWDFNCNFPNGFSKIDAAAREMGVGIGTWLGPRGGYGGSGSQRQAFWNNKGRTKTLWTTGETITSNGQGMYLDNPPYHDLFLQQTTYMMEHYDFRFFKFDGISAQATAHGPGTAAQGDEENIEGMIDLEKRARMVKPDIFLNSTVGTYASPFWFQFTDAVWRQDADWSKIGNQGDDREQWITYRDRQVFNHFVTDAPICPINTLMTHGVILTSHGAVSKSMNYAGVVRELRCAFACGSSMVELYCDYERLNNINKGALWKDIADCIKWQQDNSDVLPDAHWVGGNPWDGSKAHIYGWASWNGKKATLALRNPAAYEQPIAITLRDALDIPAYIHTTVTLADAFQQNAVSGLPTGEPIDIDTRLVITLPASTVFVWNGTDNTDHPEFDTAVCPVALLADEPDTTIYDLQGRKVTSIQKGSLYIQNGKKFMVK